LFEGDGLLVVGLRAAEGDERHPTVGAKDAAELGEREGDVEPVEGAAGGDEVDGCGGKAGGFGCAFEDGEARPCGGEMFAGGAHLVVGFDGDDGIVVGEEDFGEHAGAGADVGDELAGLEAAPFAQELEEFGGGVALAIAVVVGDAAGEAFGVGLRRAHGTMIGRDDDSANHLRLV